MNGRTYRLAGLGLVLTGIVGCGSAPEDDNPEALNPVRGAITMNGKDIENYAIVTFHPKEAAADGRKIYGWYQAEESYYSLLTEKGAKKIPGAPVGEYTVTIQPPPNKPASIPAKYGSPATSGLTAVVKEGMNNIPEVKLVP